MTASLGLIARRDLTNVWEKHGPTAIEAMAETEPAKIVQVVASVMPKQLEISRNV